eukprot:TRINITY_DN14429_c0_g1_i2.p1 TRINITY_DN14429_c0_g1~~TRINITY_DN14429_c0_g1_i2.p1  ORF type:complete len:476 (+),score=156.89 TRINITY_DN14429_c0_g1_i2:433-1860(+)
MLQKAALLLSMCLQPLAVDARISGGKYQISRYVGGVNKNGNGGQIVYLGTFGFSEKGVCRVTVTNNASRGGELSHSGFYLQEVENVNSARALQMTTEQLELCNGRRASHGAEGEADQHRVSVPTTKGKKEGVWQGTADIHRGGFWALFFYNCRRFEVRLSVSVQQYNEGEDGERNYLQVGDQNLPGSYMVLFGIYTMLVGVWGYVMHRNPSSLHKIHFLMLLLLVLKTGTMLFESLKYFTFKETGSGSTWDIFFYAFLMLKGVALFLAILLLGSGWSFLKPFLAEKDRRILLVVIPLQVVVNVCDIYIDETTEGDPSWNNWQNALRIFDIVCCCAVLLPIVWSVKNIKDATVADGKVVKNLVRLKQFQTFYVLVVGYIYFTRIVVVLIESALHYRETWLGAIMLEGGTLMFYTFTGYKFRPVKQNPYLALGEDDWEEGGERLQQELQQKMRDDAEAGPAPAAAAPPAPKAKLAEI